MTTNTECEFPVPAEANDLAAETPAPAQPAAGESATDVTEAVHAIARRSKVAARVLATATRSTKDAALKALADALEANATDIIAANAIDIDRERAGGMSDSTLDRLALNEARICAIADALREVAALPDPVGEVLRGSRLPNGLKLRQVRVPMGVVGMVYEARPNVTVDAAGLSLKSGNAVILRGGSAAAESNRVIVRVLRAALDNAGLPADLVQSVDEFGRPGAVALMGARGLVDLLVPRGGAGLIQTVVREAKVPVIETGVGNCHVYVDSEANLDWAHDIVLNAKVQRPSVCNSAETLLVHRDVAAQFLPRVLATLQAEQVTIHGDERAQASIPAGLRFEAATDEDWATEYHGLELAVRVVDSLDEAIDHIRTWTSGHTEAIVTDNVRSADRFVDELDSACVIVNASTRFTDGGEFGLGAEIGISTQKLHARGPMGLAELTTTKWVVFGEGQIRQ
ncbi:glutamate-5-semialdehyde dehydrogenase [Rarobacter faecitabidus]|uniref:Gamma-glutamyl phosphate reductase n=1 Tax=Rarobacter faecitabidus TaxID=13243 RepID=A0A542ZUY2_RARFA|nr:glutamate-5-semialdehyde dehydrogenase [Rarobacter faecitabidus]TQL64109.1 glutamate-5-semialdehyde dehydrogenase [Rarobacter faecitabidus]